MKPHIAYNFVVFIFDIENGVKEIRKKIENLRVGKAI
jgi:hypothetical protein